MMVSRFNSDDRGAVAVVAGIMFIAILTISALAITAGDGFSIKSKAQQALDTALLAGASAPTTFTDAQIIALAEQIFAENRRKRVGDGASFDVDLGVSTTFKVTPTLVAGQLTFELKSPFLGVLGRESMTIRVDGAARRAFGEPICVLGLDQNDAATIDLNGRADVHLENCAALANSKAGAGINQVGQSRMRANDIGVHGGYSGENFFPKPQVGIERTADPLAQLPEPLGGTCHLDSGATFQQEARTLTPGTYCGGFSAKSNAVVTLSPGIYIMKDGPLRIDSQASVSGNEVMIAFQGTGATLEIYSGGSLAVTSPTSGTYANIQFFGERRTYPHNQNAQSIPPGQDDGHLWFTVVGDSRLTYDGVAYLPMHHVWFAGGSVVQGSSPSYSAIAKKLWFQDNTHVHLIKENKRGLQVDEAAVMGRSAALFQ